jgi:hypothetical protein
MKLPVDLRPAKGAQPLLTNSGARRSYRPLMGAGADPERARYHHDGGGSVPLSQVDAALMT